GRPGRAGAAGVAGAGAVAGVVAARGSGAAGDLPGGGQAAPPGAGAGGAERRGALTGRGKPRLCVSAGGAQAVTRNSRAAVPPSTIAWSAADRWAMKDRARSR